MGHLYDFKFGMTKPQLLDAYAILKEKGVQHFGLHCMAASCSLENGYYPALARELFRLVCEICDSVQCIRRAETCADYLATFDVDEMFMKAKGML